MDRFYLQMHITDRCGNRCKHCYQTHYGDELSDMKEKEAETVLKELHDIGLQNDVRTEVAITGGDPLMHKDFLNIVRIARRYCDKVYIMGNPEGLLGDIPEKLKNIGIDQFQLSLDGVMSIHDETRGKGSFDRTVEGIKALKTAGIKVGISMTLTDLNRYCAGFVEEISTFYGADTFTAEEAIPYGQDCNGKIHAKCSLGFAVMAILPDLTIMACRRSPSSVLGIWRKGTGLEWHFLNSQKMIAYRNRTLKKALAPIVCEERRESHFIHKRWDDAMEFGLMPMECSFGIKHY